ncbi:MAG: hypothetical protein A3D44_00275 [Candidatus Staskawiczbacteria bacterium RIFCSPHIGHO2_02_FULL_42_22]|uniref:Uncharacterized protein n=1 Tax=Candidatus Staskawiczbacteria bacterium RIFCSPHIGHO2_02_FULL_42_22 TaxID=1802207 RepID=A0A1G2I2G5_9BACT|nr:MAG: hypothetical protein A3D44_00275 [Candidatus Staskawiczbacteria bacterium RIFCSPHIGHO2_02_FULL_42_22]
MISPPCVFWEALSASHGMAGAQAAPVLWAAFLARPPFLAASHRTLLSWKFPTPNGAGKKKNRAVALGMPQLVVEEPASWLLRHRPCTDGDMRAIPGRWLLGFPELRRRRTALG